MKRILVLILLILGAAFFYFNFLSKPAVEQVRGETAGEQKVPLVRAALVSDSGSENELLGKALDQAKGAGVNFVIGLGDWTRVGTVEELLAAKRVFDEAKIPYYVTSGDHDLWDSRNRGEEALSNFRAVFGEPSKVFEKNGIRFVIVDNSDIYSGISQKDWEILGGSVNQLVGESVSQQVSEWDSEILNYRNTETQSHRNTETLSHRDTDNPKLVFVFAHKTPFHPQSDHVMGKDNTQVKRQAQNLVSLLEERKADGLFSGDMHFFAKFKSPNGSVKITTIGAASSERNFQGPRFAILTVWNDYSWEVDDMEIRMDTND